MKFIGPLRVDVETLITHPGMLSYYSSTRKQRHALGITDTLIRLAVGVEEPEDIMADLDQALRKSAAPKK